MIDMTYKLYDARVCGMHYFVPVMQ